MKKPNFVFILTDDQSYWALGKETNCIISPTLDRLAKDGADFNNFFCACPVCSPARASILTGLMPSSHGVQDWIISGNVDIDKMPKNAKARPKFINNEKYKQDYLEGIETYTDILAENGYNIALSGKWHIGDTLKKRKGYVYWNTILRGGCSYKSYELYHNGEITTHTKYITDKITDNAIDFIKKYEDEKPFYLGVHYTAPHTPWDEEEHKEDLWKLYENADYSKIKNASIHKNEILHKYIGDTEEKRREWLTGYFSAITGVDNSIDRLIEVLKDKGEWENTVLVFTGDNGNCLGQHGVWGKGNGTYPQNMYEESIKVPFIMFNKKIIRNCKVDSLCSHVDIFPTILDIAGIDAKLNKDQWGKSLIKILDGNEERNHIVVFDEYGSVRMLRNERFKFVKNYNNGEELFFDLINDQGEEINEINNIQFKEEILSMREKLETNFDNFTRNGLDARINNNFGTGQIKMVDCKKDVTAFEKKPILYRDDK